MGINDVWLQIRKNVQRMIAVAGTQKIGLVVECHRTLDHSLIRARVGRTVRVLRAKSALRSCSICSLVEVVALPDLALRFLLVPEVQVRLGDAVGSLSIADYCFKVSLPRVLGLGVSMQEGRAVEVPVHKKRHLDRSSFNCYLYLSFSDSHYSPLYPVSSVPHPSRIPVSHFRAQHGTTSNEKLVGSRFHILSIRVSSRNTL